ncbi:MAG: TorF family putative porin [Steroidobacteraceae bacterium]
MFERRSGVCESMSLCAHGILPLVIFFHASAPCAAADVWGGSLALTSDYFVRGISRTDDQAALQLDLHYSSSSGFVAGVFASNTQIDPQDSRDVELSGFIGYAWNMAGDWRGKLLASYYAYPWNEDGSAYNYADLDLDFAYQGWLHFSLEYSPDSPRYVSFPYDRLMGVTEKSAEISVQEPVVGRLSLIAGVGFSFLDGPDSGGYTYWNIGAAFDLPSASLVLSYVDTSSEAKSLFYNAAATGRWTGTVIWRF